LGGGGEGKIDKPLQATKGGGRQPSRKAVTTPSSKQETNGDKTTETMCGPQG